MARAVSVSGLLLLVFADGTYLPLPPPHGTTPAPAALVQALVTAADLLAVHHPQPVAELLRLAAAESEAARLARMEKVLGAVETNLPRIPELRSALEELLRSS